MMQGNSKKDEFPALSSIQRWMRAILIQPLGEEGQKAYENLPTDFHDTAIESLIVPTEKLNAKGHLHIYQSSYILRLRDCMAKQFSALEFALGKELFQHFADQYLQTYPSSSYTLNDLGKNFPKYLQETRPDKDSEKKENWPDFIIELAEYEYSINILFDAQAKPDDRDLKDADFQTDESKLILRPIFQLFQHSFPISEYYRAFIDDQGPELPFPSPSFSVLLRKNYQLGIFDLKESQFIFLKYWQEIGDLAQTKASFSRNYKFDPLEVETAWQKWKALWLKQGFFAKM